MRLGHLHEKGMDTLLKNGTLLDLKSVHLEECEDCLAGKKHRVSFKTGQILKTNKLELIHSDICGLMST